MSGASKDSPLLDKATDQMPLVPGHEGWNLKCCHGTRSRVAGGESRACQTKR